MAIESGMSILLFESVLSLSGAISCVLSYFVFSSFVWSIISSSFAYGNFTVVVGSLIIAKFLEIKSGPSFSDPLTCLNT